MAYAFKSTLTIDHTQCGASDSTAFPVLLLGTFNGTGSTPDLRTTGNGGKIQNTVSFNGQTVPADINFYSDSGGTTAVSFEIAQYTASTGAIEVWIKRDISHTADTNIYMYYDDAAVNTYQGGSVGAAWDSNYKGVWHLPDGATLSAKDSTSNHDDGTINSATVTSGQIDGAALFTPNTQSITTTGVAITGNITIEGWMYPNSSTRYNALLTHGENPNRDYNFYTTVSNTTSTYVALGLTNSPGFIAVSPGWTVGAWNHFVMTADGTNVRVYINGVQNGIKADSHQPTGATKTTYLGNDPEADALDGKLDEVRVSASIRSADWITAEYNNQQTNSTFLTVGNQTAVGGGATVWTIAFIKFP